MLRLAELALFLAPFAMFFIWRFTAFDRGPTPRVVVGAACVLVALATVLVWLSEHQALPPDTTYAPARLQGGQIISGHAEPR
jgi:hypothetical protein